MTDEKETRSELIDVSDLIISDSENWENEEVIESIRRILKKNDSGEETISGWSSYIDQE